MNETKRITRTEVPEKLRILLVEDDDTDAAILLDGFKNISKTLGPLDVERVENGQVAVDALLALSEEGEELPNLILLDLFMPVMDGQEFIRELAMVPALASIPVIVLTGSRDYALQQRCYKIGANSVIVKPSSMGDLAELTNIIVDYWFVRSRVFFLD